MISGTEAAEASPAATGVVEKGTTLVPTFEVVKPVEEPEPPKAKPKATRKPAAKKPKAKATKKPAKKVAKKTKAKAKPVAKKVAKKAKAKGKAKAPKLTPRQIAAKKAAALRNADPKLRNAIKAKRAELKELTSKVSACQKSLASLEKQL